MDLTASAFWLLVVRTFFDTAARPWNGDPAHLSLSAATVWTLAGLLLVLLGWLFLPRRADYRTSWVRSAGIRAAGRVLLGAATGVTATLIATWTLSHVSIESVFGLTSYLPSIPSHVPVPGLSASLTTHGIYQTLVGLAHGSYTELVRHWTDLHASPFVVAVALGLGGFVGWMSSASRWAYAGIVTWLGLMMVCIGLIGYSVLIVTGSTSWEGWVLGSLILVVELFGLLLFVAYQFYTLEFIAGSATPKPVAARPPGSDFTPFVAVQVASYNEQPEVVVACLRAILALDYPRDRFLVQLLDDSTDTRGIEELQRFCAENRVEFLHRTHRRGFKGGALNDGLKALPPEVELIAIVDSDYFVDPAFLWVAVEPFRSRMVGFVQTPQGYRNAPRGSFARWYALADAYFYQVIQPVRARAQSLIFCGTMGLVARGALEGAGGWSETCVTEDAELSIRLISKGWRGVYIDRTLGRGLAPTTMSAVRSQHRRWANGGWQMLRMNERKLVPLHMTQRQRVDFLLGRVFWIDGLFMLGVTAALTGVVVGSWFGITLSVRSLSALALVSAAPVLLLLDGLLKIRVALRSSLRVGYADVVGVMGFWYAIKLNDLWAAVGAAFGSRPGFVRTPKTEGERPSRWSALAGSIGAASFESTVAAALFGVIAFSLYRWRELPHVSLTLAGALLLLWVGYYGLAFAAAPYFDYSSRIGSPVPASPAESPPDAIARSGPPSDAHPPTKEVAGARSVPGPTRSREPAGPADQATTPRPASRAQGSGH